MAKMDQEKALSPGIVCCVIYNAVAMEKARSTIEARTIMGGVFGDLIIS
jgi:hypothetical protein